MKLLDLTLIQLARLFFLVREVRAIPLPGRPRRWGVQVLGRGFTCLLQDDLLVGPGLIRPLGWNTPRPREFGTRHQAEVFMRYMGLRPRH